jgi:hypothetical protein
MGSLDIQYTTYLINFAQAKELDEKSLESMCSVISNIFPSALFSGEIEPTEDQHLLNEFFFYVVGRSASIAKKLREIVFSPKRFEAFPDISQRIVDCIQQDPANLELLTSLYTMPFSKEQLFTLISFIATCISLESELPWISRGSDIDFYNDPPIYSFIKDTFSAYPSLIAEVVPFIAEHIQENGTDAKYAAAIINRAAESTIGFLRFRAEGKFSYHPDSQIETDLPPLNELYPFENSDIVGFLTEDENPKIQKYGMTIQYDLISSGKLEITGELMSSALEMFTNDDFNVSDGGEMLLRGITRSNNQEAITAVMTALWGIIHEANVEEHASTLQKIFTFLKNIPLYLSDEVANQLAIETWGYLMPIYQENSDALQVGWCIGVLGSLINKISENQELITELIGFVGTLFENENESDAVFLITEICKVAGKQNPEVIEFCVSYVVDRIGSAENEKQLQSIINLCSSVIEYIEDPEQLNHILLSIISYIAVKKDSIKLKISLSDIIFDVFDKNREVVEQHAPQICALNMNFNPYRILRKNTRAGLDFIELLLAAAIETGDRVIASTRRYNFMSFIRHAITLKRTNEEKAELYDELISIMSPTIEALGPEYVAKFMYDQLIENCPEDRREALSQCIVESSTTFLQRFNPN